MAPPSPLQRTPFSARADVEEGGIGAVDGERRDRLDRGGASSGLPVFSGIGAREKARVRACENELGFRTVDRQASDRRRRKPDRRVLPSDAPVAGPEDAGVRAGEKQRAVAGGRQRVHDPALRTDRKQSRPAGRICRRLGSAVPKRRRLPAGEGNSRSELPADRTRLAGALEPGDALSRDVRSEGVEGGAEVLTGRDAAAVGPLGRRDVSDPPDRQRHQNFREVTLRLGGRECADALPVGGAEDEDDGARTGRAPQLIACRRDGVLDSFPTRRPEGHPSPQPRGGRGVRRKRLVGHDHLDRRHRSRAGRRRGNRESVSPRHRRGLLEDTRHAVEHMRRENEGDVGLRLLDRPDRDSRAPQTLGQNLVGTRVRRRKNRHGLQGRLRLFRIEREERAGVRRARAVRKLRIRDQDLRLRSLRERHPDTPVPAAVDRRAVEQQNEALRVELAGVSPGHLEHALPALLIAGARSQHLRVDPRPVDPAAHALGDVSGHVGADELEQVHARVRPEVYHAARRAGGDLADRPAVEKQMRGRAARAQLDGDRKQSDEESDGVGKDLHP